MPLPDSVRRLVQRFAEQYESYKDASYNETGARREFIDPFFKALGWDIDNDAGLAEAYKDVIHEDAIRIGSTIKAPDYCMRIGGVRKFFLEAKKPAVALDSDPLPAFQLRRYGWSAKLPLSILTSFEEFAVYDCRVRPLSTDKPSVCRIMSLRFEEYPDRWDEIAGIFSKEAILKGSFDKYALRQLRRGTAQVDQAFLVEIESWRTSLAQNLARRNPRLTTRDLNYAVQQIIDRIIFLRICEDRGIEDYGRLQGLQSGENIYAGLVEHFFQADERYNSGLFHFREEREWPTPPDILTPRLKIDDRVLKDILKALYYPESPYEFSVLPVEVLGHVYEQFLGKVIRLTAGHRAVVQEKPEVRKAGGVYYTPSHIVDYIVSHTLGELLQGKTAKEVEKLRILDPACGSGSFLLGAFQYLLDWHRRWYEEHEPQEFAKGNRPRIYRGARGAWYLSTSEKKRILLNNIYGVDIDPQAVEVTKLSLLLKVLEGESRESIGKNLALFRERALPDLASNVKCGNSLIKQDFYNTQQLTFLNDDELYRINAFDWSASFPEIMNNGGFDAVIGNPPYVLLQDDFRDDKQLQYFRAHYDVASYKLDTYHLFMERGICLTRSGGRCSMITPANFLTNNHLAKLRRFLLERSLVDHIVVINGGVFKQVSVDNAIFVVRAGKPTTGAFQIRTATSDPVALRFTTKTEISASEVLKDKFVLFTGEKDAGQPALWKKVLALSVPLGSIADVNFGKQLRDRKKFPKDVIEVQSGNHISKNYVSCYTGRDISRYNVSWGKLACLNDTRAQRGGCWDAAKHAAKEKLLTRQIGRHPEFAIDNRGFHCLNTIFMVNLRPNGANPLFVLGLLNSTLLRAFWLDQFYDRRRTFPKIKGTYLKKLPIWIQKDHASQSDPRIDRLVGLVGSIPELQRKLASAVTDHDRNTWTRRLEGVDQQIDSLVYDLYDLSPEERTTIDSVVQQLGR